MSFIVTVRCDTLLLEVEDSIALTWYVGTCFVARSEIRSHVRSIFTLGQEFIAGRSSIQKRSARRSTYHEVNGVDDKTSKIT